MAGDRTGNVDQVHHVAAEDEAQRIGIVRQHNLNHFCRGFRRALRFESHVRDGTPLAQPTRMRFAVPLLLLFAFAGLGDSTSPTIRVPSGGDLQGGLNNARPGDTILLARDGQYVGNFVLPSRKGSASSSDDRVVTVRTEGEADFPREGERMTPAAAAHLARLRSPNASPALQTAAAARGWRIALVEFQANADEKGAIIALGD